MKRYIFHITVLTLVLLFSACDEKEDYEQINSNVVEIAGEWFVQYDHEVYGADPFGAGYTKILTFNTASDNGNEIWLTDEGNFWEYKVKIPVNMSNLTFGSEQVVTSIIPDYEIGIIIKNGIIIKDAVTQPSGTVSDSIYFEIWFEDLEESTGIADDKLLVSGFRKSGFLEDVH